MSSPKRSKDWGRETEVAAVKQLTRRFPGIARTGSVNYRKAAPDLVRDCILKNSDTFDGTHNPLNLVVTRDKRQQLLVTLSMKDFLDMTSPQPRLYCEVRVQVKARQQTWIGRIYRELVEAP